MSKELLQQLLNEVKSINAEIKTINSRLANLEQGQAKLEQGQANLEQGQQEIKKHLIQLDTKNADRHVTAFSKIKAIDKDIKFIKHKLHQTEEDVFDIKDHLKLIK